MMDELQLSELARAIAHPARIALLKEIAERENCLYADLIKVFPLAQSTVSQHLRELKKEGLLQGSIGGIKSRYYIDWEALDRFYQVFTTFYQELQRNRVNPDHGSRLPGPQR